jgi:iron complex transport system substrate-binding protein
MKYIAIPVMAILLIACNSRKGEEKTGEENSRYGTGNLYSELFTISHQDTLTRLTITSPWQGSGDIELSYFLLPDSATIPEGIDPSMVIRTPVSSVVCMSTTHVAMISRLGFTSTIKGVSGSGYISDKELLSMISDGRVAETGYDSNINSELIASLEPDVMLVYGVGAESAGYLSKIRASGIPLLYISDYMETDPLARAEWIRVFGLLYQKENEADRIFENIAGEYELLKQEIAGRIDNEPVVMAGLPYKDTWYISPGNSYIGKLISDAGGRYLWSDRQSESAIPMSLESVYVEAVKADIWINSGSAETLDDIVSVDGRLRDLAPVERGLVFNNNARQTPGGGNEYWEKGVLEPHVLLLDLISIFHPELVPDNITCYYRKLQWKEQ